MLNELTQLWRPEMLWTFIAETHANVPIRPSFNLPLSATAIRPAASAMARDTVEAQV